MEITDKNNNPINLNFLDGLYLTQKIPKDNSKKKIDRQRNTTLPKPSLDEKQTNPSIFNNKVIVMMIYLCFLFKFSNDNCEYCEHEEQKNINPTNTVISPKISKTFISTSPSLCKI